MATERLGYAQTYLHEDIGKDNKFIRAVLNVQFSHVSFRGRTCHTVLPHDLHCRIQMAMVSC